MVLPITEGGQFVADCKKYKGSLLVSTVGIFCITLLLFLAITADYYRKSSFVYQTIWYYKLHIMENMSVQHLREQGAKELARSSYEQKYIFVDGVVEVRYNNQIFHLCTKAKGKAYQLKKEIPLAQLLN